MLKEKFKDVCVIYHNKRLKIISIDFLNLIYLIRKFKTNFILNIFKPE